MVLAHEVPVEAVSPQRQPGSSEGASYPARLSPLSFDAGKRVTLKLDVASVDGQPLVFTPIMNTYAHVVIFDEELKGLAHAHPVGGAYVSEPAEAPELAFSVRLPEPGAYVAWVQMQVNQQLQTLRFDLDVR